MLSLPPAFTEQIRQILGNETADFLDALDSPSPVSIRYNPLKAWKRHLQGTVIPWTNNGIYLDQRISFTADPLYHAGLYYVQEASSMMIEAAYNFAFPGGAPILSLDLCAAPGGKSTHLLSLINHEGVLISNEIHSQRNSVLRQNLARWGYPDVVVTQLPAAGFRKLEGMIDLLLCDAPCSGEGLFRKDPEAVNEWSPENIKMCAERQEEILNRISPVVKEGGFMIYSTCTYNSRENDQQVQVLLSSGEWQITDLDLSEYGAVKTAYGWQCFPHKVKGEGYYISLLQKTAGEEYQIPRVKIKEEKINYQIPFDIPDDYKIIVTGNYPMLVSARHASLIKGISDLIPARTTGTLLGEIKGRDLVPSGESALAEFLHKRHSLELSLEEALSYLRCDTVIKSASEKGWQLVSYDEHPLGWIKVLEGRVNNYYPKNWRILKSMDRL